MLWNSLSSMASIRWWSSTKCTIELAFDTEEGDMFIVDEIIRCTISAQASIFDKCVNASHKTSASIRTFGEFTCVHTKSRSLEARRISDRLKNTLAECPQYLRMMSFITSNRIASFMPSLRARFIASLAKAITQSDTSSLSEVSWHIRRARSHIRRARSQVTSGLFVNSAKVTIAVISSKCFNFLSQRSLMQSKITWSKSMWNFMHYDCTSLLISSNSSFLKKCIRRVWASANLVVLESVIASFWTLH